MYVGLYYWFSDWCYVFDFVFSENVLEMIFNRIENNVEYDNSFLLRIIMCEGICVYVYLYLEISYESEMFV